MKKNLQKILLIIFLLSASFVLHAQDFGILVDQTADFSAHGFEFEDRMFNYSGSFIPYFSSLIGDNGELTVAAAFTYRIEPWFYVPELLLTELTIRFDKNEIKLGRMEYCDPLEIIASGFFDGALFSFDTKIGTFSAGGWYTGYIFKTRAAITMTEAEEIYCYEPYYFDDFVNTYFAPARVLSSLSWEHPSFGGFMNVKFSLLGQFDFTDAGLDSQYLTLNLSFPSKYLVLNLGGCFELIQYNGVGFSGDMQNMTMALAAKAGLTIIIPDRNQKIISLQGIYTSGVHEDISIGAFLPLTTMPQGNLLNAKLAGLSIITLNFITNHTETASSDFSISYFIRNDLGTYNYYPVIGANSEGFFLGPEINYKFTWNSTSGFEMKLGAGLFAPSFGNAVPDANILWKAEASILFLLF